MPKYNPNGANDPKTYPPQLGELGYVVGTSKLPEGGQYLVCVNADNSVQNNAELSFIAVIAGSVTTANFLNMVNKDLYNRGWSSGTADVAHTYWKIG